MWIIFSPRVHNANETSAAVLQANHHFVGRRPMKSERDCADWHSISGWLGNGRAIFCAGGEELSEWMRDQNARWELLESTSMCVLYTRTLQSRCLLALSPIRPCFSIERTSSRFNHHHMTVVVFVIWTTQSNHTQLQMLDGRMGYDAEARQHAQIDAQSIPYLFIILYIVYT